MKKSIIAVLIIFLTFSIMYYLFFDINKIYREYWNVYISNPHKIVVNNYENNVSITFMNFKKISIDKILEKSKFLKMDDGVYQIYKLLNKDILEKIGNLEEIFNYYDYYILLTKEEYGNLKFDLLLLSVERKQILSINNCKYRI